MADPYDTRRNHRGVPTSIDAAAIAAETSNRGRYIVHKALCDHGDHTVDEICALVGLPRYSLQPRFTELKKAGVIRATDVRRRNVSGASAIVWHACVLDQRETAA